MPTLYQERIEKAQKMMADAGIDVLFVNNRENLIYFTGITQMECLAVLIPLEGKACAVTLWLDVDYVRRESGLDTFGYHFPRQSLVEVCVKKIKEFGYLEPRLGFERYFTTFAIYDVLRRSFQEKGFINAAELFYRLRSVKDVREVEMMRHAGRIVAAGMAAAAAAVCPEVKEVEVLAEAEYAMLKAGSDGAPFRPQVVSGQRALLTHPCASNKKIAEGEIVVIHLGATVAGYCAKMCRTVAVGDIPSGQRDVYKLLQRAQNAAVTALHPGAVSGEVDAAARQIVAEAGLEPFYLDQVGYGVGLRQSEFYPVIGKNREELIEAGMVVDLLLPTIYKREIGGPRLTDCIYVGETANEWLTNYSHELIQV